MLGIWPSMFAALISGAASSTVNVEKTRAALRCISSDVPLARQGIQVSSIEDVSSHPDQTRLVMVLFPREERSQVFVFRENPLESRTELDLQNEATFHISGGDVVFDDPPLGGVWTQENLAETIKEAVARDRYHFSSADVMRQSEGYVCSAFGG